MDWYHIYSFVINLIYIKAFISQFTCGLCHSITVVHRFFHCAHEMCHTCYGNFRESNRNWIRTTYSVQQTPHGPLTMFNDSLVALQCAVCRAVPIEPAPAPHPELPDPNEEYRRNAAAALASARAAQPAFESVVAQEALSAALTAAEQPADYYGSRTATFLTMGGNERLGRGTIIVDSAYLSYLLNVSFVYFMLLARVLDRTGPHRADAMRRFRELIRMRMANVTGDLQFIYRNRYRIISVEDYNHYTAQGEQIMCTRTIFDGEVTRVPRDEDESSYYSGRFELYHELTSDQDYFEGFNPRREQAIYWQIEDLAEYGRVTHAEIRDAARTISRWKAFMRRVADGSNMPEELADSVFALTDRLIRIEVCPYENRVYCVMGRTMRPMA